MAKQVNLNLYRTGVVADLTFSRWGAKTKLSEEDLGLKDVPEWLIQLGAKRLIPQDKMAKIDSAIAEARGFLAHNSFTFPFGNVVFIPYTRLQKVVEKMHKCEKEFFSGVEEFLAEYGGIREERLKEFDAAFEKILKQRNGSTQETVVQEKKRLLQKLVEKYPSLPELRKKFGFDFVLFEVNTPEFDSISSEEAVDKARLTQEMEEMYRKRVAQKLDLFLEDVISQLKAMILEIVEKLKSRIEKDTVSMASVTSYKKFAEAFRGLDFVDTNIDQAISQLEDKLDKASKSDLDDEKFKAKLAEELDGIKKLADNIDISKVLGKFKRRIRAVEA